MSPEGTLTISTAVGGDGTARLSVTGDVDLATAGDLYDAIAASAATPGVRTVQVDFTEVGFCDSTGIGALMRARHSAGESAVTVRLAGPRGMVRRTLEVAGVLQVLTGV
ncbi:STAS domain-containing protein [Actinoplanes couchii]|uniref:Anti-sigma factor antagonist n=1 Tax=Actinoplanes couchii TaxID=403638 RepID=A0ABQ3XNQ4_9ACTN|nr:STAS domain-containing protein [Actinoplanes couchii]MDR6319628.1 anti-anti-sigma factor [Actinoplanes couchii]GID60149.1 anti-anti-sigma factor [Actinoplanes couchii]